MGQVVEVERPLGRHSLRIAVLILDGSEHRRVIDIEDLRNPATLLAEHQLLRGRGRVDHVCGITEILLDKLALGESERLDHVAGQEPVLGAQPRRERQLRDPVRDEGEVSGALDVLGEELEEARVIDRVIVVVPGMHVERMLGHRPGRYVQHVGEPLPDSCIE